MHEMKIANTDVSFLVTIPTQSNANWQNFGKCLFA